MKLFALIFTMAPAVCFAHAADGVHYHGGELINLFLLAGILSLLVYSGKSGGK